MCHVFIFLQLGGRFIRTHSKSESLPEPKVGSNRFEMNCEWHHFALKYLTKYVLTTFGNASIRLERALFFTLSSELYFLFVTPNLIRYS